MYQKEDENEIKKVMAATLATMMCLSSFSMMNVWADKRGFEPLVINYISARGETDAALKTLKKLAEDYKKITRILNSM